MAFHHVIDTGDAVLHGFDRERLAAAARSAGFRDIAFRPAWDVAKNGRSYPRFLVTATRA